MFSDWPFWHVLRGYWYRLIPGWHPGAGFHEHAYDHDMDAGHDWARDGIDDQRFQGPSVNIDGSPMIGSVDIHGNPYGVTNDLFNDRSNDGYASSNWSSGCGGSSGFD